MMGIVLELLDLKYSQIMEPWPNLKKNKWDGEYIEELSV